MEGTEIFHMSLSPVLQGLLLYQHPIPEDTFVTTDEPTWTYHYLPKSVVYIRGTWWCVFCGTGHMYYDVYPPS